MLTAADTPTIRNAILKRIGKEPGVTIVDMPVVKHADHLAVGLLLEVDHVLLVRSRFDLPAMFDHSHLVNELDEVAEQIKAARKDAFGRGAALVQSTEKVMAGTGLRGRWRS